MIPEFPNEVNGNPMTAVEMHTRDGSNLQWSFDPPIQQSRAMAAFGEMFSRLGLPEMPAFRLGEGDGIQFKQGSVDLRCTHQSGVLYVESAEASWVCRDARLKAHALAGFFRELMDMENPAVRDLMQRWGLSYRPRPVEGQ